jgi:hypothetical protein
MEASPEMWQNLQTVKIEQIHSPKRFGGFSTSTFGFLFARSTFADL